MENKNNIPIWVTTFQFDNNILVCTSMEFRGMVGETIYTSSYSIIELDNSGIFIKQTKLSDDETYNIYKEYCKCEHVSKREKIDFWKFIYDITPGGKKQLQDNMDADIHNRIV